MTDYERVGGLYHRTRRPDARIAARIHAALGDARTVVNVGAGTGAYDPDDRAVVAVEPSAAMIAGAGRGRSRPPAGKPGERGVGALPSGAILDP